MLSKAPGESILSHFAFNFTNLVTQNADSHSWMLMLVLDVAKVFNDFSHPGLSAKIEIFRMTNPLFP